MIAYYRVTIGGVIARLEARGYLERAVSDTDRRARTLRLSASDAALLDAIAPAVQRAQDAMLQGLSADERAVPLTLLRKVTDAGNAFRTGRWAA